MSLPPHHQTPPPGLADWVELHGWGPGRAVLEVEIDGVPCVIKRRRPSVGGGISYVLRYLRALLLGVACKIFLGEFPPPGVLLRNGLTYEAERLRRLSAAGCRVPQVWLQAPGLLALEHVGLDLSSLIRHGIESERIALSRLAGGDLARFHRRGFWHGGAQIRNLTIRDGEMWRIDFEENIGEALSRPLTQAYDLFQMLTSLLSLRSLPEDVMPVLGKTMLDEYFDVNPDAAVRARLVRLGRVLAVVARPLRPLLGGLPFRDVQGFFRVAETLRLLLLTP